jgi:hypothetical protein
LPYLPYTRMSKVRLLSEDDSILVECYPDNEGSLTGIVQLDGTATKFELVDIETQAVINKCKLSDVVYCFALLHNLRSKDRLTVNFS